MLDYLVYLPVGYDATDDPWPPLVFLHGAGECGDDLGLVKRHGPPKLLEEDDEFPFLVVAPRSRSGGWDVAELEAMLDEVTRAHRVDSDRVYLTGISMGGFGTWAWAAAHPDRFAAIAPICGGGDPSWAPRLEGLPIWNFHGARDRIVLPAYSDAMVEALRREGSDVRYTLYPGRRPRLVDGDLYDNPGVVFVAPRPSTARARGLIASHREATGAASPRPGRWRDEPGDGRRPDPWAGSAFLPLANPVAAPRRRRFCRPSCERPDRSLSAYVIVSWPGADRPSPRPPTALPCPTPRRGKSH